MSITSRDTIYTSYDTIIEYYKYPEIKLEQIIFMGLNYKLIFNNNPNGYQINAQKFEDLLSDENKIYLTLFIVKDTVSYFKTDSISKSIFNSLYLKIYNYSLSDSTILFKNDSMNSNFKIEEKRNLKTLEKIEFIRTDSNDLSVGYDSIYEIDFLVNNITTTNHQLICFNTLNINSFNLDFISCGYIKLNNDGHTKIYKKIGLINFKDLNKKLSEKEVKFIQILNLYMIIKKLQLD